VIAVVSQQRLRACPDRVPIRDYAAKLQVQTHLSQSSELGLAAAARSRNCGAILEESENTHPTIRTKLEAFCRMAIEPLPQASQPCGEAGTDQPARALDQTSSAATELPVELSEFSQRLASFGLGEAPDPLLTEARPPATRRSRS
jgi:hypothetical protein